MYNVVGNMLHVGMIKKKDNQIYLDLARFSSTNFIVLKWISKLFNKDIIYYGYFIIFHSEV